MEDINNQKLNQLQEEINILKLKLEQAKDVVRQWTETSARLSQSASEARAKNQGLGRGIGGIIFGSKFRASMRYAAARSNAAIAQDVVKKRAKIADGKREAQEVARLIQKELTEKKQQYKLLKGKIKDQGNIQKHVTETSIESIDLLQKLKEAYDLGLLTLEEYDLKRQKIVSNL